jgi:hypothetical protein
LRSPESFPTTPSRKLILRIHLTEALTVQMTKTGIVGVVVAEVEVATVVVVVVIEPSL